MIIAVGCAGGRIAGKSGLPFAAINTDLKELERCPASVKLPIGTAWTHGYGVVRPDAGERAAIESAGEIAALCTEPVTLVVGLGGGTGSGAGPIVASIAKARGCEVSAVVSWPFPFEGTRRRQAAERALTALAEHVDRLVVELEDLLPQTPAISLREVFVLGDALGATVLGRCLSRPG